MRDERVRETLDHRTASYLLALLLAFTIAVVFLQYDLFSAALFTVLAGMLLAIYDRFRR